MSSSYEDTIAWEDVSLAASAMFQVWCDGGEMKWAQECWGHLEEAGLTGNATRLESTATLLRLVCLARIYREFCGLARDEESEISLGLLAEDLEIDSLALGILGHLASPDAFDEVEDEADLREAALHEATDAQRDEIFECLVKAYGGVVPLYSRMSATNQSDPEENDGEEFEVTGPNSAAFNFVVNRFQY